MARIFVYDGREHPDPDPGASIDQIKDIMSTYFPDIANASHKQEKRGADTLHIFAKRYGTKGTGAQSGQLAELIAATPPARLEALDLYDRLADRQGRIPAESLQAHCNAHPGNQEAMERALGDLSRYINGVRILTSRLASLLQW